VRDLTGNTLSDAMVTHVYDYETGLSYMPSRPQRRGGRSAQSWATFLHNHAGAVLACDFFIVVTATFQRLYVFVLLDIGTRRVVHWNLTDRAGSEWTIQQFRNGLPLDGTYRFLVHDRDGIFAPAVDEALRSMSLQVSKTPVRAPQANAHCERPIGTARRDCLDWLIPLNERHLRSVVAEWMSHYNVSFCGAHVFRSLFQRGNPPHDRDQVGAAVTLMRNGNVHFSIG